MINKLLQFELKFHSKQISFIILSILFTAYGFLAINQGFKYLEFSSMYNDAFNLSFISGIVSIVSTFATVFLCINAGLRDKLFNFEGLVFWEAYFPSSGTKMFFICVPFPAMPWLLDGRILRHHLVGAQLHLEGQSSIFMMFTFAEL